MKRSGLSGRGEQRFATIATLFGEQQIGLFEATAALRTLTKRGVYRLGIAVEATARSIEVRFTDGIADADVHLGEAPDSQEPC